MPNYTCEIREEVLYAYHFQAKDNEAACQIALQVSEGELFDPVRDVIMVQDRSVDLFTEAGTQLTFWED